MWYGVCMCTCGPPAFGKCTACGATGAGYVQPAPVPVAPPSTFTSTVPPLTEADMRRIIREEIAAAFARSTGARSTGVETR